MLVEDLIRELQDLPGHYEVRVANGMGDDWGLQDVRELNSTQEVEVVFPGLTVVNPDTVCEHASLCMFHEAP